MTKVYRGAHGQISIEGRVVARFNGPVWRWDVGDHLTIPRDSGGHVRGMIMGRVPDQGGDPYGDRYIVKDDDSPNAVYYQKKFLEREAFVSLLSFKEQAMEEFK